MLLGESGGFLIAALVPHIQGLCPTACSAVPLEHLGPGTHAEARPASSQAEPARMLPEGLQVLFLTPDLFLVH